MRILVIPSDSQASISRGAEIVVCFSMTLKTFGSFCGARVHCFMYSPNGRRWAQTLASRG